MSDNFRQKKSNLALAPSVAAVPAMFSTTTLALPSLKRRLPDDAVFAPVPRRAFAQTVQTAAASLTDTGKICDVSSIKPGDAWNTAAVFKQMATAQLFHP